MGLTLPEMKKRKLEKRIAALPSPGEEMGTSLAYVKDGQQLCDTCGEWLPLNGHYWHAHRDSDTGYRQTCKQCRTEDARDQKNRAVARRVEKLDAAAAELIDRVSMGQFRQSPDLIQMATEVLFAFGGPEGYAQHLLANYLSAKPGSPVRQKTLDRVLTLMERMHAAGIKTAYDQMTNEELAEELQRRLDRGKLKKLDSEVVDAGV